MQRDSLQPKLDAAQRALDVALDEACGVDVNMATTAEMIRVEETLAVASNAAKEVVSVRLRRRTRSRSTPAPTESATELTGEHAVDRVFDDADGKRWHVYAVHPSARTIRSGTLAASFQHGWLCFESHDERRRLAPIPDNWKDVPIEDLAALCVNAERAEKHA
jgi:hypothetical protein